MILRTEDLQDSCRKILSAVDSSALNSITDMLEINCSDGVFSLAVTNKEYYVNITFTADLEDEFHATVNAIQFLRLVEKTTSETIELSSTDRVLNIKCNGSYRIPLVYDGAELLKIPVIDIEEKSESFTISSKALKSIVDFNSKELTKGPESRKPIQNLYCFDKTGCITFTTGACVNEFRTDLNSTLLFNDKLVKLFKLFGDEDVSVDVGYNRISDDINASVIKFTSKNLQISAILTCDSSLIQSYPVEAIRGRAHKIYPYKVSLNRSLVNQSIDRLSIFADKSIDSMDGSTIRILFTKSAILISDLNKVNSETVEYASIPEGIEESEVLLNSKDFTKTLASCTNQIVNIFYGDDQAILVREGEVYWVIPQCCET